MTVTAGFLLAHGGRCWVMLFVAGAAGSRKLVAVTVGLCWLVVDAAESCWLVVGTIGCLLARGKHCWVVLAPCGHCWVRVSLLRALLGRAGTWWALLGRAVWCWTLVGRAVAWRSLLYFCCFAAGTTGLYGLLRGTAGSRWLVTASTAVLLARGCRDGSLWALLGRVVS